MQDWQTEIGKFSVQQMVDRVCQLFLSSRRKLATAAVLALVILFGFHVIFGANGMVVYVNKRAELRKLEGETQKLEQENQQLTRDVDDLKTSPKAIENEARKQGYAKPGEIIYQMPQKPQPPAQAQVSKP